jgi:hypothetical protein
MYDVVSLGSTIPTNSTTLADDILIDQCFIYGDAKAGSKRGVALNGRNLAVTNSYIVDFKSDFQDSQAIGGWYGPGPFKITNNYLEGSGENIMFGGAAPSSPNIIPSDIEIVGNYIRKPLSWKGIWRVKNLLELKNAQRVKIRGNVLENNWASSQNGFGVLFTVRTCEAGDYSWAVVADITFENNILRNSASGINILGTDTNRTACGLPSTAGAARDIIIRNNLFDGEDSDPAGRFLQVLSGVQRLTVDHNTMVAAKTLIVAEGAENPGFVFTNNIITRGKYGVIGTGTAEGTGTLTRYFPQSIMRRNTFVGSPSTSRVYPADNWFLGSLDEVKFSNLQAQDYTLSDASPYRHLAIDGSDVGADMNLIVPTVRCTGCYFIVNKARAMVAFNIAIQGPSSTFIYNYRNGAEILQFVSTSTSQIAVAGKNATFSGQGILNGQPGYTFTVTANDSGGEVFSFDTVSITITGPNNDSYTVSGTITGGDIVVSSPGVI